MLANQDIAAVPSPDAKSPVRELSGLGLAVIGMLCVIIWALSHCYLGIFHDARLYTLQALADLHPESLAQDAFLRFGSQDKYTIFSPIYAQMSQLFGIEPAAASLTLSFQFAVLFGAWLLARAIMPVSMAILGVAVLIAVPGDYGPERVFTCIEQFLTPRMLAEAMVLGSLAAALRGRTWLAITLLVMAVPIHPLMAAAGVAALACLYVLVPYPRVGVALLTAALGALMLAAFAFPPGVWGRFDNAWLTLVVNRSPYLFLSHWQLDDWSRAAVTVATLTLGLFTLPLSRARSLSQVALITTVGGLVLTLVACDLLHLVLFTQLQPWRWQWLGTIAAAILLPCILTSCWRTGTAGRATALLLTSAWVFALGAFALTAASAAISSLVLFRRLTAGEARLVFWGACGMLAIAVIWRMATNLEFTDAYYIDTHIPLWLRQTMSFARDGTAPISAVILASWLARNSRGRYGLLFIGALSATAVFALAPQIWARWTTREFPPQAVAQYAGWRGRIPAHAEVFWPESPLGAWMLLERSNYLSAIQTSGMVFSRESTMAMARRAASLESIVPPQSFLSWESGSQSLQLSQQQLQGICRLGVFDFLVTSADLDTSPVAVIPRKFGRKSRDLKLYRCADQPRAAAAST